MKIKIDKNGGLWLRRAGKMKPQECHMRPPIFLDGEYKIRLCSDSCPLFSEPTAETRDNHPKETIELHICRGYIECRPSEFVDEREDISDGIKPMKENRRPCDCPHPVRPDGCEFYDMESDLCRYGKI